MDSTLELVRRAQGGDSTALNRVLRRYLPRLHRWATGRLPHHSRGLLDTDDLVQDALVGAVRRFYQLDAKHGASFQSYLRQAVLNRIRDETRRPLRAVEPEKLEELATDAASPLERTVSADVLSRYERALEQLSDADREAVIGRVEFDLSYAELATELGKPSPDAARMAVVRALAKLAQGMQAPERGP